MTIQKQNNAIKFDNLTVPITVLNKLTKDTKYKVIDGYSIEYIGNRVYLMNIGTYNRVKLTKNQVSNPTAKAGGLLSSPY